ncbi:hypothetical protein MPH_06355 [Macrophomina phaseolina MS6]|uniref:Uncharacterized protein n=1 Tax=Macrophomina phaseolina (strain MS6) TaxID=1126212 RepID=K2R2A9_MACPH|nr:hypothetical protein MPH_06355 [Macrophomina phaseolina MS6]
MDFSAGTSSTVRTATPAEMEVEIHVHAVIVPTTVQDWVSAGFRVRFTLGPAAPMAVMLTENGLVEFTNTPPDPTMPPQPIIAPPPGIYTREKCASLHEKISIRMLD